MSQYKQIFRKALEEAVDASALDVDGDAAALAGSVDPTGDPGQYDLGDEGSDPQELIGKMKARSEQWASQVAGFTSWLNGTDAQSLINQVQAASKHPAFEGVADQTQKEIGKVSQTLAGLEQKIKLFINTAESKYDKSKADSAG